MRKSRRILLGAMGVLLSLLHWLRPLLDIPGNLEDLSTWRRWLRNVPDVPFYALAVIGVGLIVLANLTGLRSLGRKSRGLGREPSLESQSSSLEKDMPGHEVLAHVWHRTEFGQARSRREVENALTEAALEERISVWGIPQDTEIWVRIEPSAFRTHRIVLDKEDKFGGYICLATDNTKRLFDAPLFSRQEILRIWPALPLQIVFIPGPPFLVEQPVLLGLGLPPHGRTSTKRLYRVGIRNNTRAPLRNVRVVLESITGSNGRSFGRPFQESHNTKAAFNVQPSLEEPSVFVDIVENVVGWPTGEGNSFRLRLAGQRPGAYQVPAGKYLLVLRVEGGGYVSRRKFIIEKILDSQMPTLEMYPTCQENVS